MGIKYRKQGKVLYVSTHLRLNIQHIHARVQERFCYKTVGWVKIAKGAPVFSGMSMLGVYKSR